MIQMNLCTKQTDSQTEKLTVTKGERGDKLVKGEEKILPKN